MTEPGTPGRSRVSLEVYEALRVRILDLRLPPDSRITIDSVARELGVSQTPVREALSQLEGDALIVRPPGRGYRTTPLLGLDELRELFEFRLLVEPWAAGASAVNRLGNPGRNLQSEVQSYTSTTREPTGTSPRHRMVAHDSHFHTAILEAGRNQFALQAFRATHCHLHLFRLHPADWSGEKTIEEHRRIADAIRRCDPGAAEAAMQEHLMGAYRRFTEAFDNKGTGPRAGPVPLMDRQG